MKVIGQKIWNEPAAFIGLLTSIALLVINLIGDATWDAQSIIAILAPLVSALGIRQLVMPTAKAEDLATAPKLEPK